jgi:hypothetical protein
MPERKEQVAMSRSRCSVMFFALATALSTLAFADPVPKGQKTPHGGILKEAEGMHVELMVDKSDQPNLYLYDKSMKPLDRADLQAKLTVKGHDGSQHSRELKASKAHKDCVVFRGEAIKGASDWDTAVVSLKLKDGWRHLHFSHH